MRLSVDKITDVGRTYTQSLKAEDLNQQLSSAELGSSDLFASDAVINYQLSRIDHRLLLAGDFSAALSLQCGRCLVDIVGQLEDSFSLALNIVATESSATEEELELKDEQINSILPMEGEVDLLPVLEELLLLALPMHSLCSENCLGLCPYCGIDLNKASCGCEPSLFNNRFGKLKGLKLDPSA